MKADRKKQLQTEAHDCLKGVERAKSKRDEEMDSVTFARKKWEHFAGPRGLPNLVEQRRSEGIPMPFTVDMATGSRYALVKYDMSTPNAVSSCPLNHFNNSFVHCRLQMVISLVLLLLEHGSES